MRNRYIFEKMTSVDFQVIMEIGGKLMVIYEVVIYRKNFKIIILQKV